MERKVLFVVTSHHEIQPGHATGIWLSEFAEPYEVFKEAGYQMTVASIKGGKAPIDPRSLNAEQEEKWREAIGLLESTVPIDEVSADGYDAIFLPGGHGTMFDMPDNERLQALIRDFAEAGKVVSAVCHGPAGLVGVKLSSGEPYVRGKRLTAFTDEEERRAKYDEVMPFLLESRLRELGAAFEAAPPWSNHVEVDGKLVTGQNPQSGESAARKVLELLGASAVSP